MKKINTKKAGLLYGLTLLSYTGFALLDSFVIPHDGVNLLSVNELQKYTLIKVFNFSIILLSFLFHVKIL